MKYIFEVNDTGIIIRRMNHSQVIHSFLVDNMTIHTDTLGRVAYIEITNPSKELSQIVHLLSAKKYKRIKSKYLYMSNDK